MTHLARLFMNYKIYSFVLWLALWISPFLGRTQEPGLSFCFPFQTTWIDQQGEAVRDTAVELIVSIYPQGGTADFTETHPLTTNSRGELYALIGSENYSDFRDLDFSRSDYMLKVEGSVDGAAAITLVDDILGAVPYAYSTLNHIPPGSIVPLAGENAPAGWLFCDGSLYPATSSEYSRLFAAIGYGWGRQGNNFRTPDLRGKFLRGVDTEGTRDAGIDARTEIHPSGNSAGAVGSLQRHNVPTHSHQVSGRTTSDGYHSHETIGVRGSRLTQVDENDIVLENSGDLPERIGPPTYYSGSHGHSMSGNWEGTGGSESRPVNAYVFYIIKY